MSNPHTIDGYAERVTIPVWRCAKCEQIYSGTGDDKLHASRCCATRTCPDCGKAVPKSGFFRCEPCYEKHQILHHQARKRAPWDGKCMIYSEKYDAYHLDPDDARAVMVENGWDPEAGIEDARFVLTTPDNGEPFSLYEHLEGSLPEDTTHLHPSAREIEDAVNAWIEEHAPFSWHPTDIAWDGTTATAEGGAP